MMFCRASVSDAGVVNLLRTTANPSTLAADLSVALLRPAIFLSKHGNARLHLPFFARLDRAYLLQLRARHQIFRTRFSLRTANSRPHWNVSGWQGCGIPSANC